MEADRVSATSEVGVGTTDCRQRLCVPYTVAALTEPVMSIKIMFFFCRICLSLFNSVLTVDIVLLQLI